MYVYIYTYIYIYVYISIYLVRETALAVHTTSGHKCEFHFTSTSTSTAKFYPGKSFKVLEIGAVVRRYEIIVYLETPLAAQHCTYNSDL